MFKNKWTKTTEAIPEAYFDVFLRTHDNEILFGHLSGGSNIFRCRVTGASSKYRNVPLAEVKEWTAKFGISVMPTIKSKHWLPIGSYKPKCFDELFLLQADGTVLVGYLVNAEMCTILSTGPCLGANHCKDVPVSNFKYWDTDLVYPAKKKRKAVTTDATTI